MTIRFELRTTKRTKGAEMVPLHISVSDGRSFRQRQVTGIMINPEYWDVKAGDLKKRILINEEVKQKLIKDLGDLKSYIHKKYSDDKEAGKVKDNWLEKALKDYDPEAKEVAPKKKLPSFDELYDQFLSVRDLGEGRRRHYEVLRRMIHRYESYVRCSTGRKRYAFDLLKVDNDVLDSLYDYIENENEYVEKFPKILEDNPESREIKPRSENYMSGVFKEVRAFFNWAYKTKLIDAFPFEGFEMPSERYGSPIYLTLDDVQRIYSADLSSFPHLAVQRDIFVFQCNVGCRIGDLLRLKKCDVINGAIEYIPTKTIKENARTVVVPLNTIAKEIVNRYAEMPGEQLLPFESSERYNDNIKLIFEKAGITYLVTELDALTRTEKKVPINEIASSHMARRTFIGNIYKLVKDPNLVSALTGHVEGSRAFTRYRTIDIDMKKDLVKILEGGK